MKFREYLNEETLKVGDWIDTKNDIEFSVKVIKISGSKVFVSWKEDGIEKKGSCRKSIVKFDDGDWYVPNYTFS